MTATHRRSWPAALEVKAYERNFDLAWQASEADDLLEYRIYRSTDGGSFEVAAGLRPRAEALRLEDEGLNLIWDR